MPGVQTRTRKIKEFSWSFLHHMMLLLTTDRSKLDQRIPLTTYCSACASHFRDKTFGARSRKRMASSFRIWRGLLKTATGWNPAMGSGRTFPSTSAPMTERSLSSVFPAPAVHRTGSTDPPGSLGSEADKERIGSLFGKNRGQSVHVHDKQGS